MVQNNIWHLNGGVARTKMCEDLQGSILSFSPSGVV